YIRYNDGNTTQWVIASPQPDINAFATKQDVDSVLRYSSQSLTAAQQTQARQNIYAAPFDPMAFSGMQFNGGMGVNPEGVSATANGKYCCDGWLLAFNNIPGSYATQDTAAPVSGLPGRVYFGTNTAKPSIVTADFLFLSHKIEGYRIARLGWGTANAQPITIGFWTGHVLPGTYCVAVRN